MGICRRAILCLIRKKGKSLLLFLIFFLVSLLLLICFSILAGTGQAAKDLRSNIGAAFYIRPYEEMNFVNGELEEPEVPTISRQDIEHVLSVAGSEVKTYNTEHYGYAKSRQLHFIPGSGDTGDSNMGRVTAVRSSEMTDKFLTGEYVLVEGRHILPEDRNAVLISYPLAVENNVKVGDTITLTHAQLAQNDGIYTDAVQEKTVYADVEILGIYDIEGSTDDPASPTAGKSVNHILSDSHLLTELCEQQEGIYEGEISFFVADPLHLEDMLQKVREISSIDWDSHILRANDFQYQQIAGQLQELQKLALVLIVAASIMSTVVLMLIFVMRIRERVQEAGVLLAVGKTKLEILGQLILEITILMTLGFLLAMILSGTGSGILNKILFSPLMEESGARILQASAGIPNYLQPHFIRSLALFGGELVAVVSAVTVSGSALLSLQPKEILSKMN